ncbi:hypothetical protein NEMBOFW57_006915 [Staphylotrichum longicolle]|uniref:Glucose-methanol-choline oxidoreductase C-terminal domain-containing protein n=1 Tax=Staphylotrichum longicolle TaxID=669026 RepID=A0AAD4HUU5_9PEZI|nr:hypothetical protein NEMBOFW57_006915 [Staphylotrichum longicolle]
MSPARETLITEYGEVAKALLKSNRNEEEDYDVIVVGSGMGGGVVAASLLDEGKKVLVLEAGSLLFPTHVGNLSRRLLIGKFQKHVWSLWDNFSVKNYNNLPNSVYEGGQGFNLGGRSILWGGSIPRLSKWELEVWPPDIQHYLINDGGYDYAEGVFNAERPVPQNFTKKSIKILSDTLGAEWNIDFGPVAVEYAGPTEWSIPAGLFSTADLLLEDAMVEGLSQTTETRRSLTVNLNHAVWEVLFDPNKKERATGVRCHDLLDDKIRIYKAKAVVLSAGALESAKIALNSGITDGDVGRGIVDHAIYYRHFVVPPDTLKSLGLEPPVPSGTPPRNEPQSARLLIRHEAATMEKYAFDVIVEFGAQFNQGRYVDPDDVREDLTVRQGHMLCEIVFQFYAPLMKDNVVQLAPGGHHGNAVEIYMEAAPVPDAILDQARDLAAKVFKKLNALPVLDENPLYVEGTSVPILTPAKVGGVAHEVGTLRMPVDGAKGVVDKDLKFEGYENLFACDNSVFPCSPAGNPSLTLVALAGRCAKKVAAYVSTLPA